MKLKRRGLIATIVYHTLLILLLVFAGLTFPDPPPEEAGILVNFGTDDSGFGDFEPKGDDQQAGDPEEPVVVEAEEIPEEIVAPIPEPVYTPPEPTPVDQTQDVEEVKVKEEPTPEEIKRKEEERIEQIEREKRAEEERIEQEKRDEEARIEREKQAKAEKINNLGKSAFGKQGEGKADGSEGVTEGAGNQGDPNGDPGADNYGTGGGMGDGPTFGGLGSRTKRSLPLPNMSGCEITQKVEVKVEIQVNQDGKVISAIVQSASYQDNCIWEMVVKAAKESRFSVDPNANSIQTGWINYIIVP